MVNKRRQIDTLNIKHPFCSPLSIAVHRSPLTSRTEKRSRPVVSHSLWVLGRQAFLRPFIERGPLSTMSPISMCSRVCRFHWDPSIGGRSESTGLQPVSCGYILGRGFIREHQRTVGINPTRLQLLPAGALARVLPLLTLTVQPSHRRLI